MPKEYKEIKLFNGMAMSNDANDINDDVCQLTINTKDIANGKIESEQAPTSSLLNSMTIASAKVKEINDLKRISDNMGNGICIFNLKNVSDETIVAKGGITNNNLANSALTEIVNATGFSNKAKFVKFGKQARISNTAKVPYFIGYVNQQGKTSLIPDQNNNKLIVEKDSLPAISGFEADASSVCVSSINNKYIWFTNYGSGKISCLAREAYGDLVAKTIYETDAIFDTDGEKYEIKYIAEDTGNSTVANKHLYVIAEQKDFVADINTDTTRYFKIAQINQNSIIEATSKIEGIKNTKDYIIKTAVIRCLNAGAPDLEISSLQITNKSIYFSFYQPIENSFFEKSFTFSELKQKTFTNQFVQTQGTYPELLFKVLKSFTNASILTVGSGLYPSYLPFQLAPSRYGTTSTNDTIDHNEYIYMNSSDYTEIAPYGLKKCMPNALQTSLAEYFRINNATICTGMANGTTWYYYYPVPDTAILRGKNRFSITGKNNLSVLDYDNDLVGVTMSGCVNGAVCQDPTVSSAVWSQTPPNQYNNQFECNGWFVFKVAKSSSGVITVTTVNPGVPFNKWDTGVPRTNITGMERSGYIRHANFYMLVWNGNTGSNNSLTLPPFKKYSDLSNVAVTSLSINIDSSHTASLSAFKWRTFTNTSGHIRALVVFESDASSENGDSKGFVRCLGNMHFSQKLNLNIIVGGTAIDCTYGYEGIGAGPILSFAHRSWYNLPLQYRSYNDGGETSNRSLVSLVTTLASNPILFKEPFQYENGDNSLILSNDYTGSHFCLIDSIDYLVSTKGIPFLQGITNGVSDETFNDISLTIGYEYGIPVFQNLFTSAFVYVNMIPKVGSSDEGTVYERGFTYKIKMSFIYDGYQESPLSPTYKSFLAEEDYIEMQFDISLHPEFFNQVSKRVTSICLYIAKYSGEIQVELFRLIKEFKLNTEEFSLSSLSLSYIDKGNRYGSYESNTGISERTASVSLLYSIAHVYNGTLYVADINHETTPINQKEYIVCKSQPGKLSVFDYANDFAVLPFIPKVITSFNYKIYVFGDEAFAILDPNTLGIELTSNVMSCSDPDHVCSTPFGLFIYRNKRVYSVIDNNVNCISLQIERADSQSYSGLDNLTVKKLYFDNNMNSLCVLGTVIEAKGSYFQAGKPIIFALSFDTKSWKIVSPLPYLNAYTAETISEYNVDGKQYLLGYAPGTTNVTSYKLANNTVQAESLYVSKKIPIFSEFLSGFLYSVKLNFYKLSLNAVVTVKGYKDNAIAFTLTFTQNAGPDLSNFKEMANTGNTDKKINYIVVEIYGKFKDVQSIGLLTRGLIR